VAVTGGYLYGGYGQECSRFGVFEIRFPADGPPKAAWVKVGDMLESRSNHSATFVPPRIAGPAYPKGYLLAFGGNSRGRVNASVDILDLEGFTWTREYIASVDEAARPLARNSHSATLLPHGGPSCGPAILVVGGGNGDGTNGGPPRGGRDVRDGWWLTGLQQDEQLQWTRAAEWSDQPTSIGHAGRGHVACRLGRTGTVLAFSGGKPPDPHCVAFIDGRPRAVTLASGSSSPMARAFGGGCSLPDGTVLIYGGWHLNGRTFSDVWAGYAGDKATDFVARLPASTENVQNDEEDDDEMDRRFLPLLARLGGGSQAELRQLLGIMRGQPFIRLRDGADDSGNEEASEDEDDEDDGGDDDRPQDIGEESEDMPAVGDYAREAAEDFEEEEEEEEEEEQDGAETS